jgi:hypothetical protein
MKKLYSLLLFFIGTITAINTYAMQHPRHALYTLIDQLVEDERSIDWDQIFGMLNKMQGTISVNAYRKAVDQMSLLDMAITTGNLLAAKKLLKEYKADPNTANPRIGQTPLIYAIIRQDLPMIQLLLHHGANPYQKNNYGIDSFYYANTKNNPAINNLLEAYK